jgi:hypothetical protein
MVLTPANRIQTMYKIIGADGKEYGPISADQLRQWLIEGRVNAQTQILLNGATAWKTLGEYPEFTAPPVRPLPAQPASFRPQRTNGFAVTGLILGVISLVISFCCCGGLPLNLMGIIFSAIGLAQINKRPDLYSGKGVAIAGLIISCLSLLLGIGVMILGAALNWDEIVRDLEKL